MKLKRIISAVLLFSLLTGLFTGVTVYAAETTVEQAAPNNLYEANILNALGITDSTDINTVWENTTITNRKFLTYVTNMTDYRPIGYSYAILPTDEISSSDKDYNKYVYAFSNGWIKNETGIAPDKELTVDFALMILKGALGYRRLIENGATNVEAGISARLLNGVKTADDGKLSLNSAIKMLYNAIEAPYCEQSVYSEDSPSWDVDKDKTILSVNKDIYKISGRLTATFFATITGEKVGENQICVDGVVYETADKSLYSYIGRDVVGYAHIDDNEAAVLHMEPSSGTREIVIDGENFGSYTPEVVSYYNNSGKLVNVRVSDPVIIYNGKGLKTGEYSDQLFNVTEGNITLLKNNSIIDVIIINKYQNLVVGTVDKDNLIVSDMFGGKSISFDCEEFSLKNEAGKDLEFAAIKKKNVITYTSSLDGEYINAVVGGMNITEVVTSIKLDDNDKYEYLGIGSTGFYAAAELASSNDTIVIGDMYDLFINANKRVVAVKAPSGLTVNLAYMTGAVYLTFEEQVMLKLYTPDSVDENDYAVFDCAESVRVDGTKRQGEKIIDALKVYNGTLTIPITYSINSEGKVNSIDTPHYARDKENNNTLVERVSRKTAINVVSAISYGYRNHFAGKYYLSWDGICINHPSVDQKTHSAEKKNDIVITDRVRTNLNRYTDLYSLGYDSPIVYFSIADDDSSNDPSKVAWKNEVAIVKDIYDCIKDDDTEGTFITLVSEGNETDVQISKSYKSAILKRIGKFDIIRYKVDARDEMIDAEQVLDYSNLDATIGNESISWYNSEYRYVVGKCYDIVEDPACKTSSNKNILSFYKNSQNIEDSMEATYLKNSYIYTVSRGEVTIEECTPDMIRTYKGSGDNADAVVLVSTWNAVPTAVYIIRTN